MARILFVQHALSVGGAVISLRTLVEDALIHGHECHVACPTREIADIYRDAGAQVYVVPVLGVNHNTALWYRATPLDTLRLLKCLIKSAWSGLRLVSLCRSVRPGIIHLNSSVLAWQAVFLKASGYPVIWHVRENVVKGYFGIRLALLRSLMNRCADRVVCIGEKEAALVGTSARNTVVVRNYVRVASFTGYKPAAPKQPVPFVALSLGGMSQIKGASTMIAAAASLPTGTEIRIVGALDPEGRNRYGTKGSDKSGGVRLAEGVFCFPPALDVREYLHYCDVLLFWGTVPHFARPVYEAWLFGKPVIVLDQCAAGSGIDEGNAYVARGDTPEELALAIRAVKEGYAAHSAKAAKGKALAAELFGEGNYRIIEEIYQALSDRRGSDTPERRTGADGTRTWAAIPKGIL